VLVSCNNGKKETKNYLTEKKSFSQKLHLFLESTDNVKFEINEIEKSFIPDNYNEFLTKIYNINSFYDSNTFLSNNSNLNYISKSRIINSIYKVYKSNPEFPSDLFCSNIKDILANYHNINIDSSKIKRKIIINKDKKNWANILDFFITNYKNN
jgi:hypothetical protein